jgi:LCP family protein required for cell wall assembly
LTKHTNQRIDQETPQGFQSTILEDTLIPDGDPGHTPPRRRRMGFFSCFFIVLILILTSCTAFISRSNNSFFVGVKNGFIVRQLTHIFAAGGNSLKGEDSDRINFLLMGIGGPGHEGPYLTDTIILASLKPSTKEVAMISLPRDLIVPDGPGSYIKINHIYALSQKDGLEAAFKRTKDVIGNTFGIPIQYMGVVDFQGFVEVIDTIGGVKIMVDRDFSDNQFPTSDYHTQIISFKKGEQKMDGLTALRFARSRHGNNSEGSDFARSKRQQKIIIATKEKLASFNTLFNPVKLTALFDLVNQYTKTDMEPWELVKLVHLGRSIDMKQMYTAVLDDSPNGYLRSGISSIDSAYILQPATGNFTELQTLVQNVFKDNGIHTEAPQVMIQNGTTIANIATTISGALEKAGVKPIAVGNANRQDYTTTRIYDFTDGKKKLTRAYLEARFGVSAESNIPLEFVPTTLARLWNLKDDTGKYRPLDFLIILGQDVEQKGSLELIRTLTPEELRATSTGTSTPTSTTILFDETTSNPN